MPNPELNLPQPVSPEGDRIITSHKKVAEALVKMHGLHDGIWGLFLRFALAASNVGENEEQLNPAAIIPVVEIGLQRYLKETSLSVDAAKVNPK